MHLFNLFIRIRPQESITHQQPKHTQYRKIEDYIDIKQLTACKNLLGQDLSLLTNIVFALSTIVLQLGSPKSISITETLLNLSQPNNTFRHLTYAKANLCKL